MVAKNAKKKLTNLPLDEVGKVEKSIDDTFQTEKFKGLGFKKVLSVAKLQSVGAFEIKSKKHFNPAMVDYIKRGEGYFDPRKTEFELSQAYKEIYECVKNGGQVLFCSTDREPISNHLKEYGKKLKTFYVCQRWLGGTLTNYKTISKTIKKLNNLCELISTGEIKQYTKKEQSVINKKINKLEKFIGGIKLMNNLPKILITTDAIKEKNAILEAQCINKNIKFRKITIISLANVNASPDLIDYLIPCNTNSSKAQWLVLSALLDAVAEANGEKTLVACKPDEEIKIPSNIGSDNKNKGIVLKNKKETETKLEDVEEEL